MRLEPCLSSELRFCVTDHHSNHRMVSGFNSWRQQENILACAAPVTTSDQSGETICHKRPTYMYAPLCKFAAPARHDIRPKW